MATNYHGPLDGDGQLYMPVPSRSRRRRGIVLDTDDDEDRSSPSPSSSKYSLEVLSNHNENAEDDEENVPLDVPVPSRSRRRRGIVLDTDDDEDRSSPSPSSSKRPLEVLSNHNENAEDDEENVPPSKRTRVFEDSNVITVPYDDQVSAHNNIAASSSAGPLISEQSERREFIEGIDNMPLNSSAQALEVKISRAFESIQVKRKVQAPTAISLNTTTTTPRPFDPVYTKELVTGRDYIPHVYDYYNRGKTTDRKKWELCGEQGQDVRRFLMLSQNDFTETEAYTICGYFVDALNRWPDVERLAIVPGTRTKTNPETSHLLNSILVQEFPDRAIEVGAPGLIKSHGGNNWRWQVRTARIDPESFELHLHLRTLGIQTIGRDADDPEKTTFTDTQTLSSFNDVLDETTKANILRTERFLRWYVALWAREGPFMSATAANDHYKQQVEQYQSSERSRLQLYDGDNLFSITRRPENLDLLIRPSDSVLADLTNKIPSMSIPTLDMAWSSTVSQCGIDEWVATSDLFMTWKSMARQIDTISEKIRSGVKSPSICDCTENSSTVVTHVCFLCGKTRLCSSMIRGEHGRSQCETQCVRVRRVREDVKAVERRARWLWRNALRKETSLTEDQAKNIRDAVWVRLSEIFDDVQDFAFLNHYSGRLLQFTTEARLPRAMSIDAIFPFGRSISNNTAIHTADNIALIPLALNHCKHIQLPIFLQTLGRYYKTATDHLARIKSGDGSARGNLAKLEQRMIDDCRRFTDVRVKAGWTRKSRIGLSVNDGEMAYLKEEWVSGQLHPASPVTFYRNYSGRDGEIWSEEERARVLQIVEEIEEWTGVQLPRRQGCPYFCHSHTLPPDWSWLRCAQLMLERLRRMRDWCNQYWETLDTAITIYLECIFQACIRQMVIDTEDPASTEKTGIQDKYSEFLSLPMGIEYHNPLTFAVAHRHHGRQMRTGWAINPYSLEDRIDKDNNILIETRTSNYLKHRFAEASYPDLKEMVLEVDIPLSIANPDLAVSSVNTRLEKSGDTIYYADIDFGEDIEQEFEDLSMESEGSLEDEIVT